MREEIRLLNRDGRLVAIDTETDETVPLRLGPADATSIDAEPVNSEEAFTYGSELEDFAAGRIASSRSASWTMMLEQTRTSIRVQKTKPTLIFHSEGVRLEEYEEVLPRMVERDIPWEAGIGDSTAFHDELEKTGYIDPEQAREIQFNGGEIGIYTGEVEALSEELSPYALEDEEWELGEEGPGHLDPENDGRSLERLQRLLLGQKRHVEQHVGVPVSFMTARQGSSINFGELDMASETGGLLLPWDLEEGDIVNENTPQDADFKDFWGGVGNDPVVNGGRS